MVRGLPDIQLRIDCLQTPHDVVAKMQSAIVLALNDPGTKEKMTVLGVEPMIMTPADFDIRIAKEADIAVKLAKAAKIEVQ